MKALVWPGENDVRIDNVPDPEIEEEGDVIVKVSSTAICGSDLHLLTGMVPTMEEKRCSTVGSVLTSYS